MSNFDQRLRLTELVENNMQQLFQSEVTIVKEFGCKTIIGDNDYLLNYIKEPTINQQASAMIVKFAPDFILLKNNEPKHLYFVDVKHSVAPSWSPSRLKMLQEKNKDLTLSTDRIGVVAREALLSYRRYYPDTVILMACPYNSKLLMAQFADKIRCLYCYHSPERADYDCKECPAKNGNFFDIERATNAVGSQTPMTNVDLNSFIPADIFFEQLGIKIDNKAFDNLKQEIKKKPIEFNDKVYHKIKNRVLWNLNHSGCDWIDYEVYSYSGNDFYHLDRDCKWLNGMENRIVAYASITQALSSGKKTYCRKCFPQMTINSLQKNR